MLKNVLASDGAAHLINCRRFCASITMFNESKTNLIKHFSNNFYFNIKPVFDYMLVFFYTFSFPDIQNNPHVTFGM